MGVSDIVQVTLTSETAQISQASFGIPLLLSCEAQSKFPERARSYVSTGDVLADGFAADGMTYLQALAVMGQTPHPDKFVIGRRANLPTMVVTLTPIVQNLKVYNVVIAGVTFTFTSDGTATAAEIVTGLIALINASPITVTASGSTTLILTGDAAGYIFSLAVDRSQFTQVNGTTDPGVAADLAAISTAQDGSDEWYTVCLDSKSKAEGVALATAVEALNRICILTCADDDILTSSSSDLASTLFTAARTRTAVIYHPKNGQHADAAWVGRVSPLTPGSETWALKTLSGVDFTKLTSTEQGFLLGKKANFNRRDAGVSFTWEGTAAAGDYIDIPRLNDWTIARLQEGVLGDFIRAQGKVPFTDAGSSIIETRCRGVMGEGVSNFGFIAGSINVVIPPVASVSTNDKAVRKFRPVNISALYASAIHKTELRVNLSL